MAAADQTAPDFPGPDHRAETAPNRIITSPNARKYLYVFAAAVVAALVVFGYLTEDQIHQWATLTVSVLGIGTSLLAAANTPKE